MVADSSHSPAGPGSCSSPDSSSPAEPTRTGVILAAGFGSRLGGSAHDGLKPLTQVGGVPLLVRAVRSLAVAGCPRVVIVLGFGADEVEKGFRLLHDGDPEVVFAVNPRFDLQNGVSVLASRPHLRGDEFVLLMADHVVGDEVMRSAGGHHPLPGTATLLVDAKLDTVFDMDDATKVVADGDRLVQIGKRLDQFSHVDCGVFVGTPALLDAIQSVFDTAGDASLSDGVQRLARASRMHVLDIGGGFWQDIDTPEMLAHAERMLQQRRASALP